MAWSRPLRCSTKRLIKSLRHVGAGKILDVVLLPQCIEIGRIRFLPAFRTNGILVGNFAAPVLEKYFEIAAAILMRTLTVKVSFLVKRHVDGNRNRLFKFPQFPNKLFEHSYLRSACYHLKWRRHFQALLSAQHQLSTGWQVPSFLSLIVRSSNIKVKFLLF